MSITEFLPEDNGVKVQDLSFPLNFLFYNIYDDLKETIRSCATDKASELNPFSEYIKECNLVFEYTLSPDNQKYFYRLDFQVVFKDGDIIKILKTTYRDDNDENIFSIVHDAFKTAYIKIKEKYKSLD